MCVICSDLIVVFEKRQVLNCNVSVLFGSPAWCIAVDQILQQKMEIEKLVINYYFFLNSGGCKTTSNTLSSINPVNQTVFHDVSRALRNDNKLAYY